jgi:transposase
MDDGLRLRRPDRSQTSFGLLSPEDLVAQDHPVRAVWEVVESLDLSKFREPLKARDGVSGRDATDRALLVSLWLWGSVEGEWSAREVARLCERDATYRWLCGGVTVNHRMLSEFRTGHADALDGLFTQVLAALAHKGLVSVRRITQDGMKVRASAGAASFRREPTLLERQAEAHEHVAALRALYEDAERSAGLGTRRRAARERAARERVARVEEAVGLVRELQKRQEASGAKMGEGKRRLKQKPVRASTTDPDATRMKASGSGDRPRAMSDGGFRPAYNVQVASDPSSRAVVGVSVSTAGTDYGLDGPMREQVERRTGGAVKEHLVDGGYLKKESVDQAGAEGVTLYVPPKPPKDAQKNGDEFTPRPTDSEAMKALRLRMGSEAGKQTYKLRASTSETVNADLRCRRGLRELTVRGAKKVTCVALWSALAYNVMHFAKQLIV